MYQEAFFQKQSSYSSLSDSSNSLSCSDSFDNNNNNNTYKEINEIQKQLPPVRHRIKENSRLLPQEAIQIMTEWYDKNYTNPYPTYKDCEMLATRGKVSISQVKQWFVNVRRRTHNQFRKRRVITIKSSKNKNKSLVNNGQIEDILSSYCEKTNDSGYSTNQSASQFYSQNSQFGSCYDSSSTSTSFEDQLQTSIANNNFKNYIYNTQYYSNSTPTACLNNNSNFNNYNYYNQVNNTSTPVATNNNTTYSNYLSNFNESYHQTTYFPYQKSYF